MTASNLAVTGGSGVLVARVGLLVYPVSIGQVQVKMELLVTELLAPLNESIYICQKFYFTSCVINVCTYLTINKLDHK